MTAKRTPQAALALVRISSDRHGTAVGVQRQEEDCRELAQRLGWQIAALVTENDTSAFKTRTVRDEHGRTRRRTIRPGFEQVLDALDAGTADGLIVYDIDRLARQPYDLERLIDIVTVRKVPVTAVTGSVDLATSGGIAMARVLVAMASKSSEDTARRVTRALRQSAERGRPMGGEPPYGYRRGTDAGGASTLVIDLDEAATVRLIARRLLDGDNPHAIATSLTDAGVPPRRGGAWRSQSVTGVVTKPSVAGLRPLHRDGATTLVPAAWPGILDRDTWERLRAVTTHKRRRKNPATASYLLSGIATCSLCSAPMHYGLGGPRRYPMYKCSGCERLSKSQPFLDRFVIDVVVELLDRPEIAALRIRNAAATPGRAAVELDAYRARRTDLLRAIALDLTGADLSVMLEAIDERIADLEREVAEGAGSVVLPPPAAFTDLPLERQRATVRELLRVQVLPGRGSLPKVTPAY